MMQRSDQSANASYTGAAASNEEHLMCEFQDVLALLQQKGREISTQELRIALKSLGYNPTDEELQEMIEGVATAEADAAAVDMSYFLELMAKKMKDEDSALRLKEAFGNFDKDNNGFISACELRNTLKNMGQNLTERDVDRMIRLADVDGDGQVDFDEFVNMMMGKQ